MKVYADTSFLVSLYCLDAHSVRAAQDVRRYDPAMVVTPLTEVELANAMELRLFRKEASKAEIGAARAELQKHILAGVFSMTAMPVTTYELARRIALRHSSSLGTRTLDILHVASAILLRAERFWTFDSRQAKLARAEGLKLR